MKAGLGAYGSFVQSDAALHFTHSPKRRFPMNLANDRGLQLNASALAEV
jgi:hypothetical protein